MSSVKRVRVTPGGTIVTDVATPDGKQVVSAGLTAAEREAAQESIRGFATDLAQRRATLVSLQRKGAVPPPDVMPSGQISMSPEALAQRAKAANWGQEAVYGMRGTGSIADPMPPFMSIVPDSTTVTQPYGYVPYRATGIPLSMDSATPRTMLFTPHQQSRWHPFTASSLTEIPPQPVQPPIGKGGTLFPWGGDRGLSSGGGNLLTRTPVDSPPIPRGGVGTRLITRRSGLTVPVGQGLAGLAGQAARQIVVAPTASESRTKTPPEVPFRDMPFQQTVPDETTTLSPDETKTPAEVPFRGMPFQPWVPDEVADDSVFNPQPQPTTKSKPKTEPTVIVDPTTQTTTEPTTEPIVEPTRPPTTPSPRPPLKLPHLEPEIIPNTGGRYPATVIHRADVIVTTDLDTREHTAELVEMKGKPVVVARQPRPAIAKNLQDRTLGVDVLTGGGFEVQPVKRKGRHTVTPKEVEEVLPPWSKTKTKSKSLSQCFPRSGLDSKRSHIAVHRRALRPPGSQGGGGNPVVRG